MFKRYSTIILSLAGTLSVVGSNPVTVTFTGTPLPSALKTIEQLAGDDITINYSLRKLEDYTVTTEIIDADPMEAISQAIGFYPIKVTRRGQVVTVQPTLDTDFKICGRLVDEQGNGVDFATVAVLSLPDSATIACGVSNLRGDFVVPVQSSGQMALRASRLGYKTTTAAVTANNTGKMPAHHDIRMETDPQVLKTLTAYADRRVISTVGAVTNIRVEGTPYSEMGSLADLLDNLPGFSLPRPALGDGGVVYYLNGREVSEFSQLNTLKAAEIRNISIDKAPGAEYQADAAMVVNIYTVKRAGDFVHIRVDEAEQLHHKVSSMASADVKVQFGKFTTALGYQFDNMQSRTNVMYYRYLSQASPAVWHWEEPSTSRYLMSVREGSGRDKGNRLNWSGELQFNPRNRLGMYLYYQSINHNLSESGHTMAKAHGEYDLDSYLHGKSELYSGTLSYDHTGSRFTAHLAQDVAYTSPFSNLHVIESKGDEKTSRFDSNDHEYFVSTTNARFGLNLSPRTVLNFGGRLSYIESTSYKWFMDHPYASGYEPSDGEYGGHSGRYNHMNVNETTAQGYLSLSQRIGNVLFVPGIRYEYTDRWIGDDARVEDPSSGNQSIETVSTEYDHHFSHWLPSLTLRYTKGDFNTAINYVSRMTQPTFSMLNSGLAYEDNFTYYRSNPELKPAYTNEMRLSVGYRGLNAEVAYTRVKNGIAEIEEPVGSGDAVYRTPINLKNYHEVDVNLAYTSSLGRLGYYVAGSLVIPGWNTVHYSSQKVTFNAEINLTYRLNRHFSLYTNFKHIGSCRWMVYDRIDSQLWNLGASASLLDNRLTLNLEATDLLDRDNTHSLSTVYNQIESRRYMGADTRGVRLRVAYTLFNKPIRTKVSPDNTDTLDRIQH